MKKDKKIVIYQAIETIVIAGILASCYIIMLFHEKDDFSGFDYLRLALVTAIVVIIIFRAARSIALTDKFLEIRYFVIPTYKIAWEDIQLIEFVDWRTRRTLGGGGANGSVMIFEFQGCPTAPASNPLEVEKYLKVNKRFLVFHRYTQKKEQHYIAQIKRFYSGEIVSHTKRSQNGQPG